MSLQIEQAVGRLSPYYSRIEEVATAVLRCTRTATDREFAVHYIDLRASLPSSTEELRQYQDEIVGRRYFDGPAELQWNTYLYFVVPGAWLEQPEVQGRRTAIEGNCEYARKFVVAEEAIEQAVASPVLPATSIAPVRSAFLGWQKWLEGCGLSALVFGDGSVSSRLRRFESGESAKAQPKRRGPKSDAAWEGQIVTLDLVRFRRFPVVRNFSFGRVNLLVGPNGAGKTSLLEAVELFYCGRTKRNPDQTEVYELDVSLRDRGRTKAKHSRDLQIFRDRNLAWYGESELRTNNLYESFSRFNFLNADAAAGLAASGELAEQELAKLLVGSEASEAWKAIQRTLEAVQARLRDLRREKQRLVRDLKLIRGAGSSTQPETKGSQQLANRLRDALSKFKGPSRELVAPKTVPKLREEIGRVDFAARNLAEILWPPGCDSLSDIRKRLKEARKSLSRSEVALGESKRSQSSAAEAETNLASAKRALAKFEEWATIVRAGVPQAVYDLETREESKAQRAAALRGEVKEHLAAFAMEFSSSTIAGARSALRKRQREARTLLADLEDKMAKDSHLRQSVASAREGVRRLALDWARLDPHARECPVCSASYEPGELQRRIRAPKPLHLAATDLSAAEAQKCRISLAAIEQSIQTLEWLAKVQGLLQLEKNLSIKQLQHAVRRAEELLAEDTRALEEAKARLKALEKSGFTRERLAQLASSTARIEPAKSLPSKAQLESAQAGLVADVREATRIAALRVSKAKQDEAALEECSVGWKEILGETDVAHAKIRLAELELASDEAFEMQSEGRWPKLLSLSAVVAEARSIGKLLDLYEQALLREGQQAKQAATDREAAGRLEKELQGIQEPLERVERAEADLSRLSMEQALEKLVAEALRQNRARIEGIFARIHSPAEFQGLGRGLDRLVRQDQSGECELSQISTGQREALALSIFLSFNAELQGGPSVVMMDDPFAHVDNLNALSFMDYLRELVLAADRQVFFATASERVAALFEKKFSFLGAQDFRRLELQRGTV